MLRKSCAENTATEDKYHFTEDRKIKVKLEKKKRFLHQLF